MFCANCIFASILNDHTLHITHLITYLINNLVQIKIPDTLFDFLVLFKSSEYFTTVFTKIEYQTFCPF